MSKVHQDLIDLYSKKMFNGARISPAYSDSGLINRPVSCFCCENAIDCEVKIDEPIYTGYLGDCASDIMVIGEAPSSGAFQDDVAKVVMGIECQCEKGASFRHAHLGGYSRNILPGKNSPRPLLEYVKDHCGNGKWPYFTDLIKCGVLKQHGNKKGILDKRQKYCPQHILIDEIKTIMPKMIICCHWRAHREVVKIMPGLRKAGLLKGPVKVVRIYHYSGAVRGLNINDKLDWVWPIQTECSAPAVPPKRKINGDPKVF